MPTYEYECGQCGHRFEHFQGMSEAPLTVCPECGGAVRRLIGTGGGIIFKGSGFYATDYKSSAPGCGRERPCCGRSEPCDSKPCER
jgi:putative FmdB family regulatory protein